MRPAASHIAKFVRPERCTHCGHKRITWSPSAIVEAAIAWSVEHGRAPRAAEWRHVGLAYPNHHTVTAVFGSWNRMIAAAKLDDRSRLHGSGPVWGMDEIANVMLDYLVRTGHWPKSREWAYKVEPGEPHRPSVATVILAFGSWNAARRYAGWTGDDNCSGCGAPRSERTRGCKTCSQRHRWRGYRAATKTASVGRSAGLIEPPEIGSPHDGRVFATREADTSAKEAQAA